jgi:hypothetical protein
VVGFGSQTTTQEESISVTTPVKGETEPSLAQVFLKAALSENCEAIVMLRKNLLAYPKCDTSYSKWR